MKTIFFITCFLAAVVVGCATSSSKINAIRLGMTPAEVIKVMGQPTSTSAEPGVEYMVYQLSEGTTLALGPDGRVWPGQRINSYYVRIKNGVVDSYGRVGDFDSTSIPQTKQTIDLNVQQPVYADAYLTSGNAKAAKGDLGGAIVDYTKAIELKPDLASAYYNRGLTKQIMGDFDAAIGDCNKAIQLTPDLADAYITRGNAKHGKGDLDGAIVDYTKAIELKPDLGTAYYNRGNTKAAKGDSDGAIADYTKAIQRKPDLTDAYENRSRAKAAKGDLDGAIADCNKAIDIKPDYAAYSIRGVAKQGKGDLSGAIADETKTIEIKPDYADAYLHRGYFRYDSDDFTEALVDFRKGVELDVSNDYGRFWLWLVRSRLGEAQAATTELQTYLAGRTTGKVDDWPSKIGHFLAGHLAEQEFLAAAKNTDQKKQAGQLCEAYFYAGSKHLLAGDKPVAVDYFQKSIATDCKAYVEYARAVAELKSLTKPKN